VARFLWPTVYIAYNILYESCKSDGLDPCPCLPRMVVVARASSVPDGVLLSLVAKGGYDPLRIMSGVGLFWEEDI